MKNFINKTKSRGTVAVECALMLPLFLLLFSAALFFGKVLWHYTVLQKAAQDAATFLARASIEDIRGATSGYEIPIAGVARSIAANEISELFPGDNQPTITITCNSLSCGGNSVPAKITVGIEANMTDPLLSSILGQFELGNDIVLTATASTDFIEK
jgi:Flp pilus assembly protein TadG